MSHKSNLPRLTFVYLYNLLALVAESVHKELSSIKDKWRELGKSLKLPSNCLSQFVGLSDPLLEVIIHWIKGAKEPTPSWDIVVTALRCPAIDEDELAEKIFRLYCDPRQKEKGLPCSGINVAVTLVLATNK